MIRSRFEVPEGVYLRGHAVGCLPRKARDAAGRFFDQWAGIGANAWGDWIGTLGEFRAVLGRLLGARPEDLSPQVNLSSALTKVIGSLPERPGRRRVLYGELDFPSLGFVCQQAARLGYEPVCLPEKDGALPLSVWDEHLTPDVQVAHITHVLSNNSYQVDVPGVLRMCRERGIFTVVDVAQSAGVVPIDLSEWNADCVIGCSVKWLCGGPGASFLWVRGDLLPRLAPVDVGWFSHARPFELDIHRFEYAADGGRFWGGTPSVLPFAVATEGLRLIEEIGIDRIRAHSLALTRRIAEAASAGGLAVNTPLLDERRGGTMAVGFPDNEAAVALLGARRVQVDFRPRFGVRFSPHIYNTMEEIEQVCALFPDLAGKTGGG